MGWQAFFIWNQGPFGYIWRWRGHNTLGRVFSFVSQQQSYAASASKRIFNNMPQLMSIWHKMISGSKSVCFDFFLIFHSILAWLDLTDCHYSSSTWVVLIDLKTWTFSVIPPKADIFQRREQEIPILTGIKNSCFIKYLLLQDQLIFLKRIKL